MQGASTPKVPNSPVGSYRRCNSPGLGMYEMRLGDSTNEEAVLSMSRVELVTSSMRGDVKGRREGASSRGLTLGTRTRGTIQDRTVHKILCAGLEIIINKHPSISFHGAILAMLRW